MGEKLRKRQPRKRNPPPTHWFWDQVWPWTKTTTVVAGVSAGMITLTMLARRWVFFALDGSALNREVFMAEADSPIRAAINQMSDVSRARFYGEPIPQETHDKSTGTQN